MADQYFEDFIVMNKNCNFIDAGGFDGFTSLTFSKWYRNYGKIFYFEPAPKSFKHSKQVLKDIRDVVYFQNGLWNKTEILRFNSSMGNSSRISETGEEIINVVAIDDVINEPVSFIKIDIEGAEQNALVGAQKVITKYKPVIAVCVYHKQADMIEIPEFLLNLNPDYNLYFRHYTQGTCESVMYFV
jgi:FkbM family methyltransferase